MKRLFFIVFFFPLLANGQVNIWISDMPDTLVVGNTYNLQLKINAANDFSSLMLSVYKPDFLTFDTFNADGAKVNFYSNVVNVLWVPYSKENNSVISMKLHVDGKVENLPPQFKFKFLVSYLINGLKGEQTSEYKYVLRRKNNLLVYVFENQ